MSGIRTVIMLALVGSLLSVVTTGAVVQQQPRSAPRRLIIVLRSTPDRATHLVAAQSLVDHFARLGLNNMKPLGLDGGRRGSTVYLGSVDDHSDITSLMDNLRRSSTVLSVEPDVSRDFATVDPRTGPLDREFVYQTGYYHIGVVAMWARGLTGIRESNPVTVAVIDTGVALDHPDIKENLVAGYDFVQNDTIPQDEDPNSHGSMVAGIIGARINNVASGRTIGVAGVGGGDAQAGTRGLRIMPLRIAQSADTVDCSQVALALDYAIKHGARIINMSFGGNEPCDLERSYLQQAYAAGIALVAAAGNNGNNTPVYPAAYTNMSGANDQFVVAVAGLFLGGVRAYGSSYGTWVDISAPFRLVRSIRKDGGYASGSGTSFSAPLVSAVMGVLMSNYGWTRDNALRRLLMTADNLDQVNPALVGQLGAGRINADQASQPPSVYLPVTLR